MKKIKNVFINIGQFIFNPIKKIGSIPISDKVVEFFNRHVWLRLLISLVITGFIIGYYYFIKK